MTESYPDLSEQQVHLSNNDPVLAEVIEHIEEPVIESTEDVFFDLVSCIVEQQIHYRARGSYMKKLLELLNDQMPTPALISSLDPYEFAKKKISGIKYKALMSLADYWERHHLDSVRWFDLDNEDVKAKLLPIKGIGEWTVDMILLYTLGRPDVFNPNDFQLKKAMILCYGLKEGVRLQEEMGNIARRWKPYRSTAVKYLLVWRKQR